jgi:hypothetical protein
MERRVSGLLKTPLVPKGASLDPSPRAVRAGHGTHPALGTALERNPMHGAAAVPTRTDQGNGGGEMDEQRPTRRRRALRVRVPFYGGAPTLAGMLTHAFLAAHASWPA